MGKNGVSYIDDFEASKTSIDIKNMSAWKLSSIPIGNEQDLVFQKSSEFSGFYEPLNYGTKRAKLAWYVIDPLFYRNTSITPNNVNQTLNLLNGNTIKQQSYHYSREILENEVFPNKDPDLGSQITNLSTFDIAYYPYERGPYNYTVSNINSESFLDNPRSNWAGNNEKIRN